MKRNVRFHLMFLLLMVLAFNLSGCSKLFGPSDQEVINALNDSGVFKDLTLQSPIVILEKGGHTKDGSWPVTVKVIFTYIIKNEQISAPVEKTLVFKMFKSKDDKGHSVWKVKSGS